MMLTEVTAVPTEALPIDALKEHLRLGSGFAMAPAQDTLLESYLRAALATIEGRVAKALYQRRFSWRVEDWSGAGEVAFPVAPVESIISVTLFKSDGSQALVSAAEYRLVPEVHRPRLVGAGTALPTVPTGGHAVVEFAAGFGAAWEDIPADLRQAVLLLAADYYEHRHDDGATQVGLPFGVVTLIERWRQIRILGGRGRT